MLQPECLLDICAAVVEKDALRYTPAGIPVVTAVLKHASTQLEAGIDKQIDFEIAALAAGEISGRLDGMALGEVARFSGFLARKRRHGKSLVFHIKELSTTSQLTE